MSDHNGEKATSAHTTEDKRIGRRDLLKALAAAGGAVTTASLLPGQWAKPVVEAGVLPAHAQTSVLAISNMALTPTSNQNDATGAAAGFGPGGQANANAGFVYRLSFNYNDPQGLVDNTTRLLGLFESLPSGDSLTDTTTLGVGVISGNGFSGQVSDIFTGIALSAGDTQARLTIYIQTSDGRQSNQLSQTVTPSQTASQ